MAMDEPWTSIPRIQIINEGSDYSKNKQRFRQWADVTCCSDNISLDGRGNILSDKH